MKKQWRLIPIILLPLTLLALSSWYFYEQSTPAQIYAPSLNHEGVSAAIHEYIEQTWTGKVRLHDSGRLDPRNTILILAPWGREWNELAPGMAELAPQPTGLVPSSLRGPGVFEGKRIAYPVAVDQVELAFRRDLFTRAGLVLEERVLNLLDLEKALKVLAANTFFPLVISGGSDKGLTDFVSVMVLSLGGRQAYLVWQQDLEDAGEAGWKPGDWSKELVPGFRFNQVLEKLADWKKQGLLHPEWFRFQERDTLTLLNNNVAAATVIRLSEHRAWPLATVRRLQASSFPALSTAGAAEGIVGLLWMAAVPEKSRWNPQAKTWLKGLPNQVFQTQVLETWGLAPVNSTVSALDREANDLRFWAAASRGVLPPLDLGVSEGVYRTFVKMVREQL